MEIRQSLSSDLKAIGALHLEAFGAQENEIVSKLALALAGLASPVLSLVAVNKEQVIGHVIFSPVSISTNTTLSCVILAPLAVSPAVQKQGVGSRLIRSGLDNLAKRNVDLVFVLGDPNYYCRSGFKPCKQIKPPYLLPYPEAWQAKELKAGVLHGVSGTVACLPPLMSPELW